MKSPSKIVALACWVVVSGLLFPMAVFHSARSERIMIEEYYYKQPSILQILRSDSFFQIMGSALAESGGYVVIGGLLAGFFWFAKTPKRKIVLCILALVIPLLLFADPRMLLRPHQWMERIFFMLYGQIFAPLWLADPFKYFADALQQVPHSSEWWRERSWGVMWLAMGCWTYSWLGLLAVEAYRAMQSRKIEGASIQSDMLKSSLQGEPNVEEIR